MLEDEQGEQGEQERREQLQHVLKTDPDPRVRRRAHAVLLVEEGHTQAGVARRFHTSAYRVHVGQERFGRAGREGLADRSRGGRPPNSLQRTGPVWRKRSTAGRRCRACPPWSGRCATSKRCCSGSGASP